MPNFAADKLAAAVWARDLLNNGDALIWDNESTGLGSDARICQMAIINLQGMVLLDTLVNPECPIPAEATAIHGITDDMVKDAPTLLDIIIPQYNAGTLLFGKQKIVIYNADYDLRVLRQHLKAVSPHFEYSFLYGCAMQRYASFVGDWNSHHKSYRWQKLPPIENYPPHQAVSDCFATLALIKQMAAFVEYKTVDDIPF